MKRNLLLQGKFPALTLITLFIFLSLQTIAQPVSWDSHGIGGGGALFAPSISPFNSQEMYLACDMTEIFHTTNAGVNWSTVNFSQLRATTNSKIQFTSDPNVLYAIHNDFVNDLFVPVKSIDGGTTWSNLASDPTMGEAYYLFADDASSNRIVLASYNKIYFSSNGGSSFTNIYTNNAAGAAFIGGVFWDGTSIYIGGAKSLIVSTNNGVTFSANALTGFTASRGIISFAGAKVGGTTRFFAVSMNTADIYPGITGADYYGYKSIYKMDYSAGASWTAATTGITASVKPFFVSMAKNNINTVYVAGGNSSTDYPSVYKTTDGGANWSSVFLANNNQNIYTGYQGYNGDEGWYYDEFAEGFTCSLNDANVAVITGLGYPHYTMDGGVTWKQQYVNPADQNAINTPIVKGKNYAGVGLENTSCWSICWSDATHIFAGYSDITGMQSIDGGTKWNKLLTNLTENSVYKVIRENASGKIYVATSSVHDMYQSTYLQDVKIDGGTGAIKYSSDFGSTWTTLHDFGHPVIWIALDQNTANKMYACVINSSTGGIYVSSNINLGGSSTWIKLNNPPRTEGHPASVQVLSDGTLIAVYSGRRDAAGTFLSSSGVFKSSDGGTSWSDISDPGMYYWTKSLTIDPNDATQNTFYTCVFSGWGGPPNGKGGIYKTTNRGTSWTKINTLDRVESCTFNPSNANQLYVTTEANGLWISNNMNLASPTFTLVSNYPFQHPLSVFFNPFNTNEIWVTSFGNGMRMGLESTGCTAPINLVVSGITSTSATLTWDAVPGASSYRITKRVTGIAGMTNYNSLTNSYTFTGLTPGSGNKVYVKAKCGTAFSDKSVTVTINTPARLGEENKQLVLFPNPAKDYLIVQFYASANTEISMSVYDMEGRKIKTIFNSILTDAGVQQKNIDLSGVPDGIYLLRYEDGHSMTMNKFIRAQ